MQSGCHESFPYFFILKLAHGCFFICCVKIFFPVISLSLVREFAFFELLNDLRAENSNSENKQCSC